MRYEPHGRVRLITIDRAERMNSLDFKANDELIEIWREFGFHACDGGLVRLPQVVGVGNAMEIILSGDRINAEHVIGS